MTSLEALHQWQMAAADAGYSSFDEMQEDARLKRAEQLLRERRETEARRHAIEVRLRKAMAIEQAAKARSRRNKERFKNWLAILAFIVAILCLWASGAFGAPFATGERFHHSTKVPGVSAPGFTTFPVQEESMAAPIVPTCEIREVPGFDGYFVGRDGTCWSCRQGVMRPLKSLACRTGYLRIRATVDGKQIKRLAHRVVLEAFVGPCPDGMEARHLNGIRTDNRVENLCWGTRKQNMRDRDRHGTTAVGERQGSAKLNPAKVREIRQLAESGMLKREIAKRLGVCVQCIRNVCDGRTWQCVA